MLNLSQLPRSSMRMSVHGQLLFDLPHAAELAKRALLDWVWHMVCDNADVPQLTGVIGSCAAACFCVLTSE